MYLRRKQERLLFGLNLYNLKQAASSRVVANYLIFGLLLFAFAVRLYKITWIPMSRDEIITISKYVPLPIIDIFALHYSNNHSLASTLAHLFSPQADHLFMLRWPFILVGLVSLPFVYRFGADLFGRRVGLLAFFLVSVTPVYIGYSVIVRGYGGLISLTAISTYFLWKALRGNCWYDWLGFVAVSILVIFFHLFGMLAVGLMLALVGIGLAWETCWQKWRASSSSSTQFKPIWLKFGIVTLLLALIYASLVYIRFNSVLAEGGYSGEFEVWRDGISGLEDLAPLKIFIGMMAPMSAGGFAAYIYLIFWGIGLAFLWKRQRPLAMAGIIWFLAPFVIIFVAMQILGKGFYAYVRFLVYLLPTYLLLVAVGMRVCVERLSNLAHHPRWRWPAGVMKWGAIAGWLALTIISLNWYIIRATNTDWPGMAKVLAGELRSQDITICEEYQRGVEAPDRAKPYCMWMLGFFTGLEEYTPRFQSTTDFIANYEHIRAQQAMMSAPGGVWLVIWHRIVFNVEHLITDQPPEVVPLPLSPAFAPYQARQFGSAALVYVNSERTLLENIYKTVELLLQLEQSPTARARYYRSLADLEAIQGHKNRALEFLESSRAMLKQTSGVYPEQFLGDTQQAIDRIPDDQSPPPETAYPAGYKFGPSICLQAYEVSPAVLEAGQSVTVTLYWRALDFVDRDYTFFFQFEGQTSQIRQRLEFDPFDRTYPTPWWWPGQQLVERREFVIPANMPAQNFVVRLGASDRGFTQNEVVMPLFLMSADGVAHWHVQSAVNSTARCP